MNAEILMVAMFVIATKAFSWMATEKLVQVNMKLNKDKVSSCQ